MKEDDPTIDIVSAAPVSSAEGFLRAQRMMTTGLENVCDRVAFHVYAARFIERLAELTEKPIWITESGAAGPTHHLDWYVSTFETIRAAIPQAEQIYWFDLFDFEPNGFRLYEIVLDPIRGFRAVPESTALIGHLKERVRAASGDIARASYDELIPDITLYFPTEEDLRLIEETSFGLPEELR